MSKFQSKISFPEKKKTTARLQETFELKEKLKNPKTTPVKDSVSKSPRKNNLFEEHKLPRSCNLATQHLNFIPLDKENVEINVEEIFKRSPKVVLYRTPIKSKTKEIEEDTIEDNKYTLRSSPLKRGSCSENKNLFCENGSSPPKRECPSEETPSQLITKLALETPEREHKPNRRKELFPKGEFDEACKALHSAAPTKLPGREDKLQFIKDYLLDHSQEQTSGTLYISGPPGTGKTACVNIVVSEPEIAEAYKLVCLNCTSLNTCGSIYQRIVSELKLKALGRTEKAYLTAIERHLASDKRKMILIVLDELDQLCSSKQSVLYSVFEWPSRPHSRLLLLGIANALDLTDRLLPRLQARLRLQPTVLHFPSYSRQQIIDIIADRLHQAGVKEVFSGPTLQLLAGKVAAVNGDVRRALDIARRVVEVAERRTVLQPLLDNGTTRQTVALQEVMSVVNDVYSTAQILDTSSQSSSFPLQQRLLICALLLLRQTNKARDVTIGKLHEVYKKVCERRNLSALDMSEFISLTSLVEARGVLRVVGKTLNRLSKLTLQWDEREVKSALQDKHLLAEVLLDRTVAT